MDVGDGAGRSDRDTGKRGSSAGGDVFGFAVSRIGVSQLCESVGFQSAQCSALDVLADVAVRYACSAGRLAVLFANLSGRSECNAVDVVNALEDLGMAQGFAGASDGHRRIVDSGIIQDILHYLCNSEEVPFAKRVLNFPLARARKTFASFAHKGELPPGGHIPNWLPVFPDRSAYDCSSVENIGQYSQKVKVEELVEQKRKMPHSVLAIKKWLAGNEGNASISLDEGDLMKRRPATAETNPFLMSPLPSGAKEVSRLDFKDWAAPDKQERCPPASVPAVETMKNGVLDSGDGCRRVSPIMRSTVQFSLNSSKRRLSSLPVSRDVFCEVLENEEKNEKRLRNELVVGAFVENQVDSGTMHDVL